MKLLSYIVVVTAAVLVLLIATLRTTSTPLGGEGHDLVNATSECQRAVREMVADASFPFQPNVSASGREGQGERLQLSGSMDSGGGQDRERRNYVCYLSESSGRDAYVADSVEVWKSH